MFNPPFLSGIILIIGIIFYLADAGPDRLRHGGKSGLAYTVAIAALTAGLAVQSLLLPQLHLYIPNPWGAIVHIAGVMLIAGAVVLHAWARSYARQQGDAHQLLDGGPYAWVRHPLLSAFLLYSVGLLLVDPSVPILILCACVVVYINWKARREEGSLENTPGYADYTAHTPRFFPKAIFQQLLDIRSTDPDDARRRKLLNILLLGVVGITLVSILTIAAIDLSGLAGVFEIEGDLLLGCLAMLVGCAIIFAINRWMSGQVASWLFLALLTLVFSFTDTPRELVNGRSMIGYIIPVVMAGVLLEPSSSFIAAGLTSALVFVISVAAGIPPNWIGMLIFFLVAQASWLSARSLQRALGDLRAINRELDQRVQDRTRELAEAVAREHTAAVRNKTILEAIGDGVLVTDRERRVILANPAAGRMAVLPEGRGLEDRLLSEALRGVEPEALEQIEERMAADNGGEHSIIRFEWNRRTVAANVAPVSLLLPNQSVVVGGHVMALRDITREVQLDRMKTIFLGAVSHELRTPMAAIRGYVEVLSDLEAKSLSEAGRKYLGIIDTNIRRLLTLANDLIDLSRIEVGEMALYREWTSIVSIVEAAADTVRQEFEKRSLSLAVHIEPGLPQLYVDQHRITQILLNLLTNAYKYTVVGGVTVNVSRIDNVVQMEVSDTGVGLTEEEQARLFERFFRSNNEVAQKAGGSGLGLAITKSLVELHGGTITFKSEYGKGTAFTVRLPIGEKAAE